MINATEFDGKYPVAANIKTLGPIGWGKIRTARATHYTVTLCFDFLRFSLGTQVTFIRWKGEEEEG